MFYETQIYQNIRCSKHVYNMYNITVVFYNMNNITFVFKIFIGEFAKKTHDYYKQIRHAKRTLNQRFPQFGRSGFLGGCGKSLMFSPS